MGEAIVPGNLTPDRVVRFYGNTGYALELIRQNKVALVHVRCLNDPFDPYCFFETGFGESLSSLLHHVRVRHPADFGWFQSNLIGGRWAVLIDQIKTLMNRMRNSTFVFSTCAELSGIRPEQNLYMWGHYANGHRGVAIEFNAEKLAKDMALHNSVVAGPPLSENDIWTRMEYADTFPPLTAEDIFEFAKQELEIAIGRKSRRSATAVEQYYRRYTTIKSRAWSLENEWRLMWRNDEIAGDVYQVPISAGSITRMFLGMSLSDGVREEIINAARRNFPGAEILQARKKHGDFGLRFERA